LLNNYRSYRHTLDCNAAGYDSRIGCEGVEKAL
jgi:hypothetical protein